MEKTDRRQKCGGEERRTWWNSACKLELTRDLGRAPGYFSPANLSIIIVSKILALPMRISIPRRGDGANVCYVALRQ